VKLFRDKNIQYTIRGNGQNLLGFAVNEGAIIDLNRMKTIDFDEKNWLVNVGPGVTAFDLQKQAQKEVTELMQLNLQRFYAEILCAQE